MKRPRKGSIDHAAQTVATLMRGGPEALKAVEDLLDEKDTVQIRCSAARKRLYEAEAKRKGKSLSAWLRDLADAALPR
jgi:hypothetical protein